MWGRSAETDKEFGVKKTSVRIALLALVAGLGVLAAEPGHTAYRPHDLVGRVTVHAILVDLDDAAGL